MPVSKDGLFPVMPMDSLLDVRIEIIPAPEDPGISIEYQHHEGTTGGIPMHTPLPLYMQICYLTDVNF